MKRSGLPPFFSLGVSLSWSHLREHRLRSIVTLFGVILGVAVTLAVRLANTSIERSFVESFEAVAGKSQLEVSRGDLGLEETLLPKIAAMDGVAEVIPRIEEYAAVTGSRDTLLFLGLDLLSANPFQDHSLTGRKDPRDFLSLLVDPHSVLLTRSLADALGLAPGNKFSVVTDRGTVDLVVRGVLEAGREGRQLLPSQAVLMDLSAAQWLFRKTGKVDRIGIVLKPGALEEVLRSRIVALGKGSFTVGRPEARTRQIEKMIASFQLNLTILSFLALGVGVFLIYNALSFAVIARREEIGVLRAIGMKRSQVLALFLAEGAFYGLSGSFLGIFLGWALANGALKMMARTVGSLYVAGVSPRLIADPSGIALGILFGLGAALAGTFVPALEAARIVPRESLSHSTYEEQGKGRWLRWAVVGL
ncbi:MAG TPA: FtsX-like permease family protein, partial [bacterium]|nr:FtsX-like permease family protein [bacterium]